jgi:hypothetical protein
MGRTIDRGFARMVALKRIFTGVTGLLAGAGCIVVGMTHGGRPPGMLFLAMAIFFGGGAWSLRDGLRLKRDLDAPPG